MNLINTLGTASNPITGKAFKESLIQCLAELVNKDERYLDEDGGHRIHIKFANGRMAVVEVRSEDEEFEEEPFLVHDSTYQSLRKNWTSVSASIVFGIAFAFNFKNAKGHLVRLVLYKSQSYPGDDFVDGIVAQLHAALEFDAITDINEKMESGFKRLERLIKGRKEC
ncbi:hypothetical protein [Comamonas sp.]|uniref:hypothetical protein n=1 Tax=Comamonas sp. TaxID=34028 RepID=UPI003A921A99